MPPDATSGASAARKKTFFRGSLLAGGVLVLAVFAAYQNSFSASFVFDDGLSIAGNPTIRKLWPPWSALSPPQNGLTVSGRPLVNLSLAINYAAGGVAVRGYHALNLAIHLLAGLTLLGVVRRTLLQPALGARFGAAALPLALAVALLWTLHPLQTESVTYVVQRAESLMGLFYLLTLYCFIRGAGSPAPGRRFDKLKALSRFDRLKTPSESRGQSKGWQALAVAACLAGMATKEVMVSAPLMVLLYDRTFVAGTFREAWRRRWKLYAGLAATWLLLGYLVVGTGNRGGTAGFGVGVAWWAYAATQFRAIVCYLMLSVWPHPLILDRGTGWIRKASEIVPYVLIVVPLAAGVLAGLGRRTIAGLAGAWFFAILAPTSLVPGTIQMIVEHRMYLPLAAVVALGAPGIYVLLGRRSLVMLLLLAAGLGALTSRRNEDYRSELSIWKDTLAKSPDNARAHYNMGFKFFEAGRVPESMEYYKDALRLDPDYVDAHSNLGSALFQMGRVQEALDHYETALRLNPRHANTYNNLGLALARVGREGEAFAHYGEALRLNPDYAAAHNNLGLLLVQTGRIPEAIKHYEAALRADPDNTDARNNLGIILGRMGRVPEAIRHYREALRLKPDSVEVHHNLGDVFLQTGRVGEAIRQYEEALRLKADSVEAHTNLGNALVQAGRTPEAIQHYETALQIRPDYAPARNNLARVQALLPASGTEN